MTRDLRRQLIELISALKSRAGLPDVDPLGAASLAMVKHLKKD